METWKLLFKKATGRGAGFGREPIADEFAVDLQPSDCGSFTVDPTRYQFVGGAFSEYPGWQAEKDAEKLATVQVVMIDKIKAVEDSLSYAPFKHADGKTYKVSAALSDTFNFLTGMDITKPLPLNNGCWDDNDGHPVPMTIGQFNDLFRATYIRGAKNYGARQYHIGEMLKAADPAAYDYSAGWAV